MAKTLSTGKAVSLLTICFLSNWLGSVKSYQENEKGGNDLWLSSRPLAQRTGSQLLAGHEGREADYESSARRQREERDATTNRRRDAKLKTRGGDKGKWGDRVEDMDNSRPLKERASFDDLAKRKWSENNVRIWGKRRWSSKGLHMWGKRPKGGATYKRLHELVEDERDGGNDIPANGRVENYWRNRNLAQNRMNMREGGGDDLEKRKWAKNSLKIWGKRDESGGREAMEGISEAAKEVRGNEEDEYHGTRGDFDDQQTFYHQKRNSGPSSAVEQKWGKKGWANNNVRIWG